MNDMRRGEPMSKVLYDDVNAMMAKLGAYGEIDTNAPEVIAVMQTLGDIDEAGPINPWISVKDRLPDEETMVLCFDFDEYRLSGSCLPWICAFVPVAKCFYSDFYDSKGNRYERINNSVTHWMPLPDPPLDLKSSPPEK